MNNMSKVIVPDSTQINADDLLTGPMTIKITDVKIKGGKEQPVSIFFEGSDKAYRCCKSMARVLVHVWGADASKYVGRSLTLYCDPKVTWAGMAVGGIRISHMSDIESPITMALTATRGNKKPFTVKPLTKQPAAAQTEEKHEHRGSDESASAADPTTGMLNIGGKSYGPTVTDESLVADIGVWCKRKKFETAYDMAQGIKDEALKVATVAKIDNAKAYVELTERSAK